MKKEKIEVTGRDITVINRMESDFISLTDIARYKDDKNMDDIVKNWLRNRNTIELLGFWELLHNVNFKPVEFDGFRKEAGLNSFTMTPKKWVEKTGAIGIISASGRYGGTFAHKDIAFEFATLEQLVVLSNLESINSVLIEQGSTQSERLVRLNRIAINKMKSLLGSVSVKKLKEK